jgi:acetylornithine deacetylase
VHRDDKELTAPADSSCGMTARRLPSQPSPAPAPSRPPSSQEIAAWIEAHRVELIETTLALVRHVTVSPFESSLHSPLRDALSRAGCSTWLQPLHPGVSIHPRRSRLGVTSGTDRSNLRARLDAGRPELPTILFSAHLDTVPAGAEFPGAFEGRVSGGAIVGRGAADTKGNIAALLMALRFLAARRVPRTCHVELDFVIEEEIGGNGALSTALHGLRADGCVVLEPTDLEVFRGHRGCLGFRASWEGTATHMGAAGSVNPIAPAAAFVTALGELEARWADDARQDPDYAGWARPVQLNVGRIEGGSWHGTRPDRCTVLGNLGFLPQLGLEGAARAAEALVARAGSGTIAFDAIHNDAYVEEADLPFVVGAAEILGHQRHTRAWNVSCDARTYHQVAGIPTVIFGAGTLAAAHSSAESVSIAALEVAACRLASLMTRSWT